jgi:nifR3 family TIM-barrel protein
VSISGLAFLAPMSGVSDLAMRRIALRFGAGLAPSEMVACDSFLAGTSEARLRADGRAVTPHVVQIVGHDIEAMRRAALLAEDTGADIIDINMGCPAKRVAGALAGSALMRDLDRASRIIESVVAAVSTPVTVKMRLGWDQANCNAAELPRVQRGAGAAMLTVHGRTRQQFYDGRADWAAIRRIVDAVTIPVVANGDCTGIADAAAMLAASGAKAVMIGRAAIGQPWLVGQVSKGLATGAPPANISASLRLAAAREHFEFLVGAMGAHVGLGHARKHLSAYAQEAGAPEHVRLALVTAREPAEVRALLDRAFDYGDRREAA